MNSIVKYDEFGAGWYRFDGRGHFEYNPYASEFKATIPNDGSKRMPFGTMAMQRGGYVIQASILGYRWSNICGCYMAYRKSNKTFFCKKYQSKLDTFKAAANWMMKEAASKNSRRQMDFFPEMGAV